MSDEDTSPESKQEREAGFVLQALEKVREREAQVTLNVILLGATFPDGCGRQCISCRKQDCDAARRRLTVHDSLNGKFNITLFEEYTELERPSVDEESVLMDPEIDIVIAIPESFGSVAEMVDFSHNPKIAPKMLVFVKKRYHPQYGNSKSYLRNLLGKLDAKGVRVYHYRSNKHLVKIINDNLELYRSIRCIDVIKET